MLETNSPSIEIERTGKCAIIRFVKPQTRNPLSISTLEKLDLAFSLLEVDESITGVIFTGSGGAFASGADLGEIAKLNAVSSREFALRGQNLMQKISRSDLTSFAVIDGYCFGGALDLAIACRFRIASPRSIFCHPGVNLGIITGWGGTQMLPRLIGNGSALELFLTAKRIDSNEALRIGLIDEIIDDPFAKSLSKISG